MEGKDGEMMSKPKELTTTQIQAYLLSRFPYRLDNKAVEYLGEIKRRLTIFDNLQSQSPTISREEIRKLVSDYMETAVYVEGVKFVEVVEHVLKSKNILIVGGEGAK